MLRCPKTEEESKEVTARFSPRWNYHNCLGTVDGKHIAMKKPPSVGSYYYNFKGFHSIALMPGSNASYKFLYVDVGVVCRMEGHGLMMLLRERIYRYRLSRAQHVENLCQRYRCFLTTMLQYPDTINLITTCACMHNLIIYPHAISEVDCEDPESHDLIPGRWKTDRHLQRLPPLTGHHTHKDARDQRDYLS